VGRRFPFELVGFFDALALTPRASDVVRTAGASVQTGRIMFQSNAIKLIAACAVFTPATVVFSHITLEQGSAEAGAYYKAVLKLPHGCEASPTTAVTVLLPEGVQAARPMAKAGWKTEPKTQTLATPYESHGKTITQNVTQITWSGASVPANFYDEFVFQVKLPQKTGPLWFKVLQTCEQGKNEWVEVPSSGTSTKGLKQPAALLEVKPASHANHH
jgi:periplasmic copper chaperone A